MKKNKFIYSFSAITLACIISFSGLGSTYIQAHATSVGIERPVWNDEESVWDNILMHLRLYMSFSGVFTNPSTVLFNAQDFYDFMISDGVSHDTAHGVFCDCDETHTSFSGQEHGGGGHVRDGISMDEDGNVTYSDEVSDLFHGFICNYLETESGYWVVETMAADEIPREWFSDEMQWSNLNQSVKNLDYCFLDIQRYLDDNSISYIGINKLHSLDFVLISGTEVFNPSDNINSIVLDSSDSKGYIKYSSNSC